MTGTKSGVERRRILAHRGVWNTSEEQNSLAALAHALNFGFGIETDLRDRLGEIVISHDPPGPDAPTFRDFLGQCSDNGIAPDLPMGLNIKSDGLSGILASKLNTKIVTHQFFFDMSFPDQVQFNRLGLPIAQRVSDLEPLPIDNPAPKRVWLDSFERDWFIDNPEFDHWIKNSSVYLVSPELHKREPNETWKWFKEKLQANWDIYICTDRPHEVLEL